MIEASMQNISPASFYHQYRDRVREVGCAEKYSDTRTWTALTIQAADYVCRQFGLEVWHEYLRLDCAGVETNKGTHPDDWHLRVAFEHEEGVREGKDWRDELCKLAHIVADLRVLVGYCVGREPQSLLRERVITLEKRMIRVPGAQWLFVLGSGTDTWCREPWHAFTLAGDGTIVRIRDENPLCPKEWAPSA